MAGPDSSGASVGRAGHLLVLGCGYAGQAIGQAALHQGMRVWVTSRSLPRLLVLEGAGFLGMHLEEESLCSVRIDVPVGSAVISIPPTRDEAADARHEALRGWTRFALRQGAGRLVYLSSTSVYGDAKGAPVNGESPCVPNTAMGERRLEAEEVFLACTREAGAEGMVLRLPGIYGPGRTLRDRLLQGSYRLVEGGRMLTNRIFVDDLAEAALVLLARGEEGTRVIAVDDHPFEVIDLIRFACERLGLPLPPIVSLDEVPARTQAFYMGSKRCMAPELHRMGWRPRWPSFREGLPEAWRREDAEAEEGAR